jgi:hypothetical protein
VEQQLDVGGALSGSTTVVSAQALGPFLVTLVEQQPDVGALAGSMVVVPQALGPSFVIVA